MQKFIYTGLACITLISMTPALADDSPSAAPVKSPQQLMDDCVVKHRAADASLTVENAKKACQREQQLRDNHPSIPPGRSDVPQT